MILSRKILSPGVRRAVSNCLRKSSSTAYTDAKRTEGTLDAPQNLTTRQREALASAIRVDQAGELAADAIYRGQLFVLGRDLQVGPVIQTMWEQEKKHLKVMNQLQTQHRVRPTALWQVAQVTGWGLGAVTALMGKEAAMACTEAVETAIGEHYSDQLKEFQDFPQDHPSIPLLRQVIEEFRDDELEHLDTAVDHDSQKAPGHALLTAVIQKGCEIAIEACKRV